MSRTLPHNWLENAGQTTPGIFRATVRALEQGSGTLASWEAALTALGLVLRGRNLPGGEAIGERLMTLRRRRGLSQEAVARGVGVTKPTIDALERKGRGRLSTLQGVLDVLGAGAYLLPSDEAVAFFTHAGNAFGRATLGDAHGVARRAPPGL